MDIEPRGDNFERPAILDVKPEDPRIKCIDMCAFDAFICQTGMEIIEFG